MSKNNKRRLATDDVQADRSALRGLQTLGDYAPANSAYSVSALASLGSTMEDARNTEAHVVQALAEARAAAAAAEWAFHEGILGARAQVVAQYGPDAPAVQLLGLKRKSERRKRTARRPNATT